MRLIDADKLIEICRKGWRLFGYHDEKLKHWVDEYDIRSQPTVKAIPIEWIEKWVDMLKERNYHSYQILMPALIEMLEAWGKENEKSGNSD